MDLANMYTDKAYLANSYELKAFAKRHKKTDKIDAKLIADVLRKGYPTGRRPAGLFTDCDHAGWSNPKDAGNFALSYESSRRQN